MRAETLKQRNAFILGYAVLFAILAIAVLAVVIRGLVTGLLFEGDPESILWTGITGIVVVAIGIEYIIQRRMTPEEREINRLEASRYHPPLFPDDEEGANDK